MSKAEEKSQNRYPTLAEKYAFIDGYEQAEKDLELTWKDMRDIYDLAYNLRFSHKKQKEFFEELLKRFKERKAE